MAPHGKSTGVVVKKHKKIIKTEGQDSHVQCMRFDRSEQHKANYFDLLKFCSWHICK